MAGPRKSGVPYRSPPRRAVAPSLLADKIYSKIRNTKGATVIIVNLEKKKVVAYVKLVPRSLGTLAHVLRKGVAGLAGVGETF